MMDYAQARSVVAVLFTYFPREKEPPEATREAWALGLVDFDAVDALAAANELGRTSRFLPSLAELREAARRMWSARLANKPTHELAEPEGIGFLEWLSDYATPDMPQRIRRVAPTLAEKYGIALNG
jgi:hypothetical protein